MTSPGLLKPDSVATFVIARCGLFVPGVVASAQTAAAPPAPSFTHAWLKKVPASTSAWTIVWLAVQLIVPPTARLATGFDGRQTRLLTFGSVTRTLLNVTLPSLVATIV